MQIKLGQVVRDKVTGFEGIASCVSEFLTGCRRICVTPRVDKDGRMVDSAWFDDPRLDVLDSIPIKLKQVR